jgi:hypothetical protein
VERILCGNLPLPQTVLILFYAGMRRYPFVLRYLWVATAINACDPYLKQLACHRSVIFASRYYHRFCPQPCSGVRIFYPLFLQLLFDLSAHSLIHGTDICPCLFHPHLLCSFLRLLPSSHSQSPRVFRRFFLRSLLSFFSRHFVPF